MKLSLQALALAFVSGVLPLATSSTIDNTNAKSCKCFPGDACWPSEADWSAFNATVGGRLIKTVPLGSPCHDPHYDEAKCKELRDGWLRVSVQ